MIITGFGGSEVNSNIKLRFEVETKPFEDDSPKHHSSDITT